MHSLWIEICWSDRSMFPTGSILRRSKNINWCRFPYIFVMVTTQRIDQFRWFRWFPVTPSNKSIKNPDRIRALPVFLFSSYSPTSEWCGQANALEGFVPLSNPLAFVHTFPKFRQVYFVQVSSHLSADHEWAQHTHSTFSLIRRHTHKLLCDDTGYGVSQAWRQRTKSCLNL